MAYQEFSFTHGWPFHPVPRGSRVSKAEIEGREQALRQARLFAELPKRHLRSIARASAVGGYRKGDVVVEEGAPGSSFFVILDGKARVVRAGRTIAHLEPGNFFGEISLLDGGPRTATVLAETDLRCLDLAREDFREMLEGEPAVAMRVVKELARRLRDYEKPPVG